MVVHPDLGGNQNLINIELDRKLGGNRTPGAQNGSRHYLNIWKNGVQNRLG